MMGAAMLNVIDLCGPSAALYRLVVSSITWGSQAQPLFTITNKLSLVSFAVKGENTGGTRYSVIFFSSATLLFLNKHRDFRGDGERLGINSQPNLDLFLFIPSENCS